ncbi:hypothetical protein [Photobacterium rosenbergii]|uniref:hypothetical protein n=1 Tax=Photobacterium rosenbergii TaxID=294936 RepID=UPI001C993DF3|nr:hypothetical protein [Photobacterium rosenbergii]MBY5947426.1 hypothetical protein [Photobacterium rosenbergii]
MLNTDDVMAWSKQRGPVTYNDEDLHWIVNNWPELRSAQKRELQKADFNSIRSALKSIPTGQQRLRNNALTDIQHYLVKQCQWRLPPEQQDSLNDADNVRFHAIMQYSHIAEGLADKHHNHLIQLLDEGHEPTIAMVAMTLLMETAPMPLALLCQALTTPETVEKTPPYTLNLLINTFNDAEQRVRYQLSPMSAKLLSTFFCYPETLTIKQLMNELQSYLSASPFYLDKLSKYSFSHLCRCHWYLKTNRFFTEDMATPEMQWAIPTERYQQMKDQQSPITFQEQKSLPPNKAHQPHNSKEASQASDFTKLRRHLITEHAKNNYQPANELIQTNSISWPVDNIAPALMALYTAHLIKYGGVREPNLANRSIRNYTSYNVKLLQYPLPLDACWDDERIQAWANALYGQSQDKELFNFLKFVAQQPAGDGLDIDELTPPAKPKIVDPNLVNADELDTILKSLDIQHFYDPLKWLFCRVAVSLSFHGCLRRGEILRLRICDVHLIDGDKKLWRLDIRKTKEGNTKSKKPRYIFITLPSGEHYFLKQLLKLKQSQPCDEPLIGYLGESISARAQHYLLPITRVIKSVCGSSARFHHLRHGGVTVLFQQGYRLVCHNPKTHGKAYTQALFDQQTIANRFSYWLEEQELEYLNSDWLQFEITRMIGHQYFATTRLSYLHGHDWLYGLSLPSEVTLTKQTLRILFSLPKQSGDLSRRLKALGAKSISNQRVTINRDKLLIATQSGYFQSLPNSDSRLESTTAKPFSILNQKIATGNSIWSRWLMGQLSDEAKEEDKRWLVISHAAEVLGEEVRNSRIPSIKGVKWMKIWLRQYFNQEEQRFDIPATSRVGQQFKTLFSIPILSLLKPTLTLEVKPPKDFTALQCKIGQYFSVFPEIKNKPNGQPLLFVDLKAKKATIDTIIHILQGLKY